MGLIKGWRCDAMRCTVPYTVPGVTGMCVRRGERRDGRRYQEGIAKE